MKCKQCSKELTGNYQIIFCSLSCSTKFYIKYRTNKECPKCGKLLKSRWNSHIEKCGIPNSTRTNGRGNGWAKGTKLNEEQRKKRKGRIPWNKGICMTEEAKKNLREKRKLQINRSHSEKTIKRLSEVAKERGLGGYQRGSGRGKKGWYKGHFCDSSWELAFLIYHLDNNIHIERCNENRSYEWNGSQRIYKPDFKVGEIIYEIKGFKTPQWEAKHQANLDIICLQKDDIQKYLKYVIDKYGKDFIKLYETGE